MTTRGRTSPVNSVSGMTIIEVMVALVVFGIVAAGLAANSIAAVRHNSVSRNITTATLLAQDEMEQLRALDPSANPPALGGGVHSDPNNPITAAGAAGGTFTRRWTVTRDVPTPGLASVSVTVSWTYDATRTVQLLGYVCEGPTCA